MFKLPCPRVRRKRRVHFIKICWVSLKSQNRLSLQIAAVHGSYQQMFSFISELSQTFTPRARHILHLSLMTWMRCSQKFKLQDTKLTPRNPRWMDINARMSLTHLGIASSCWSNLDDGP